MPLSDADYLDWLKQSDKDPTCIISVTYYDVSASGLSTLYISSGGYIDPNDIDAPHYKDVIINEVIVFEDGQTSLFEDIVFHVTDNTLFVDIFHGYVITIKFGDRSWPVADFRTQYTGKVKALNRERNDIGVLTCLDISTAYFEQIVDPSLSPQPIDFPYTVGEAFNMKPARASTTQYKVYNYDCPAPTEVRKNGVVQTLTTHYTVAAISTLYGWTITFVSAPGETDIITCDAGTFASTDNQLDNHLGDIHNIITVDVDLSFTNPTAPAALYETAYVWYRPEPLRVFLDFMFRSQFNAKPRLNSTGNIVMFAKDYPDHASVTRTVGKSETLQNSVRLIERLPKTLGHRMGWYPNWFKQDFNLTGTISEALHRKYSNDYSYMNVTRTLANNPLATQEFLETVLTDNTEAIAVNEYINGMGSKEWSVMSYTTLYTGIYDFVDDTITLEDDDFGLSNGEDHVIIKNDKNLTTGECKSQAWRDV